MAGVDGLRIHDHLAVYGLVDYDFRVVVMKTKPARKKKKPLSKLKKLEKECFDLWSDCIIERDKVCRVSQSDERLSGHHIRSRTHHSTRFDLENGICLSWKVHFLQKANPERFQDMIIDVIGDKKYQELKIKSLKIVDQTVADLEDIKSFLTQELKHIRSGLNFKEIPF